MITPRRSRVWAEQKRSGEIKTASTVPVVRTCNVEMSHFWS